MRITVVRAGALAITAAALVATPAAGQLAVEARAGAAIGNHTPAAAGFETVPGVSLTGVVEHRVAPWWSAYAAVFRASFGCAEGFCTDQEATITTQGLGGGVRVHRERLPWLRLGAVYYSASVTAGSQIERTDASPGYEVGTGMTIPIGARLGIVPAVYFRNQLGDDRTAVLGAEIGVRVSF